MKTIYIFTLLLSIGCPLAAQSTTDSAAQPAQKLAYDLDYDTLWNVFNELLPDGLERQERARQADSKYKRFSEAARAFAAKYPQDPRRFEALVQSSFTRPQFITGFTPEFDEQPGEKNLHVDKPAVDAWLTEQRAFLTEVITASDATPRQRGGAVHAFIIELRTQSELKGERVNLEPLRSVLDHSLVTMPDGRALSVVEGYLNVLKTESPGEVPAFEARIQSFPTLAAAIAEASEKRRQAAREAAMRVADLGAIKFTAADGREVDVARLKGKVVLIDFWATWCGPCVAELPNVRKVYATYHDKGFEVVGVTLERGAGPNDTPEQATAKLEAAKRKMVAFAAKNEMPWPQHFDGQYFKNEFAMKFGINSIPAMFLLGKDGKVAATDARGEKLEAEVKRLLAL